MYQKSLTIFNRDKHSIKGVLTLPDKTGSWPMIVGCHGLYSCKEFFLEHWGTTWKLLHQEGYGTLLFDFTNNPGESYGKFEEITIGQEVADLEDVLTFLWTKQYVQKERIGLFGHSLGGMAELIAASSSHIIRALVAIAPVFKFAILRTLQMKDEGITAWKEKGFTLFRSNRLQKDFKINYRFYEEGISYNMPALATRIEAPILVITGDQDTRVPINHSLDLSRHIPHLHDLLVIENGDHNLQEPDQQRVGANKTLLFYNKYLRES